MFGFTVYKMEARFRQEADDLSGLSSPIVFYQESTTTGGFAKFETSLKSKPKKGKSKMCMYIYINRYTHIPNELITLHLTAHDNNY